jgi:preprotein translocase subunit YajC
MSFVSLALGSLPLAQAAAPTSNLISMLTPIAMIMLLFYFLLLRPERQKQAQQRTMLEAIKKDDHVVTFSGIYGVVMNVQREADKVTLKIDENTGARLQVTLGSISRVVRGDQPADQPAKSPSAKS